MHSSPIAQSPTRHQPQAQGQAEMAARENARINTLLDINSVLLKEVVHLQEASSKANGSKLTREYIEYMRRVQANLAYLVMVDRVHNPGGTALQAPAIMTPPTSLPAVHELYAKLNELFLEPFILPMPRPESREDGAIRIRGLAKSKGTFNRVSLAFDDDLRLQA